MNIRDGAPANALQGREPQEADFLAFFAPREWQAYRPLLIFDLIFRLTHFFLKLASRLLRV
jgi:hypothetical protein